MEKIEHYENEEYLSKVLIFWLNWMFKDDEDYHFTENNLVRSLKCGKVLYELTLRLEKKKEENNNKTLFLPQRKKPMTKINTKNSLNKLFFTNSFEKLRKLNFLHEEDLNEISYEDFEKDQKGNHDNLNLHKVLPFFWKLMKEYKSRNFKEQKSDYVTIEKTNQYSQFLSDLKSHVFEESLGITSILDSKEGIFVVDHFDPNANQNTFMTIGKSKIVGGKEQPTIFTRFGEGLDQKEIDYAIKTTLETKNNLIETCAIIFTEAYKETPDFSQVFLPQKRSVRQDFKISKSIDANNLTLRDIETKDILDENGNIRIHEDQIIVFHSNVEVVFASHQRNPLHTPALISKWRELYPGFERNYSFCSDLTLFERVEKNIKNNQKTGKGVFLGRDYPISPTQDILNNKLENEVLKQEVLHDNVIEEMRQHNICKMFDDNQLRKEVLKSEKRNILGEFEQKESEDQLIYEAPHIDDFSQKEISLSKEIDLLKRQLESKDEIHIANLEKLKLSLQDLEKRYVMVRQKYNFLRTTLILLFYFVLFGFYFYMLSSPLI